MDYDDDAGASPWATSPPPNQTSFNRPLPGEDNSPQIRPQHNYNTSIDSTLAASHDDPQPHQQAPPSIQNGAHSESPYNEGFASNGPRPDDEPLVNSLAGAQQQAQRNQAAQRYHGQPARKPQSQYKLQAKITALERTGKKDVILRFDVYVCTTHYNPIISKMLTLYVDQPATLPNNPIPRRPPYSQRVRQVLRPSQRQQPRSSCTSGTSARYGCRLRHGRR